jgi:hypothetical protein
MGPHRVGPQSQWGPIGGPICSTNEVDCASESFEQYVLFEAVKIYSTHSFPTAMLKILLVFF